MLRNLLATTAIASFAATGALAQDAQPSQNDDTELQLEAQQTPAGTTGAAGMGAGQQITVNSGDTIVIQPDANGVFSLNFQFAGAANAQGGAMTTPGQAGAVPENLQQGDPSQLSIDNLMGSSVYGANDENIGSVGDVLLTEEGEVEAMIVDVGGFLGIGTRQVAIGVENLRFMLDTGDNWYVFTPFTSEELEAQPEYDETTYGEQRDEQLLTTDQPMEPAGNQ